MKLFTLTLFLYAISFADSVGQYQHVLNSYASNPNNTGAGGNCQGGTNLPSREDQSIQNYGAPREQDNQCNSGDKNYAQCMKRLFKVR